MTLPACAATRGAGRLRKSPPGMIQVRYVPWNGAMVAAARLAARNSMRSSGCGVICKRQFDDRDQHRRGPQQVASAPTGVDPGLLV